MAKSNCNDLLQAVILQAFKDQHIEVNVEQANVSDDLPSGQKPVDINISIVGESQVTYQDVYDTVSKSGYV